MKIESIDPTNGSLQVLRNCVKLFRNAVGVAVESPRFYQSTKLTNGKTFKE